MKSKITFLGQSRPLLCCMIQAENPTDAIVTVRNAAFDGCDAYGFQHCKLNTKYRDKETVQSIFAQMEDKPIYVTNYRHSFNEGMSDEELADGLVTLVNYGATLCDVMGDLYAEPHPQQLTEDKEAIAKQRRLIDRIHEAGGEVLMSSHIMKFTPAEEVLRVAKEQQARGADIVKLVTAANSEAEELENLRITNLLAEELDIPFLFLSGGSHYKLHRMVGPMLGCVMYLCVQQQDALSTRSQPVLRSVREVLTNFDYKPERRF